MKRSDWIFLLKFFAIIAGVIIFGSICVFCMNHFHLKEGQVVISMVVAAIITTVLIVRSIKD